MKKNLSAIACLIAVLTACGKSGEKNYFPLDAGMYWRYTMTYQTMDGTFSGMYAVENLGPVIIDNEQLYIRRLLDGSLNYIKQDNTGIQVLAREKTEALQTERSENTRYIYRFPLVEGAIWEEERITKALIQTGPDQKTEFHINARIPVVATIDSIDEVIEVPAGIFSSCIRIRYSGDGFVNAGNNVGKTIVSIEEVNWYAPQVGLVKSIRKEKTTSKVINKGEIILELEAFRE